jgi:hypothetical protein
MEGQAGDISAQPEDRAGARGLRAKAFWTVTAGIIPGDAMPEYGRQWCYTDVNFEHDQSLGSSEEERIFVRMDREAHDYAKSVTHPSYVNWVKVEFLWI